MDELEKLKEKERELWAGGMNKETKIFYLCDRKACRLCSGENCDHTKNIEHARNFKNKHGIYVENDNREKEDELEKALRELIKLGSFELKDYEIIEGKLRHILNMFRG